MRHYIRQGVTLTGLSTDPFSKATSTCDAIYAMLLTHFPDGSMINWENTMYEGHIATNFSARYFTNRNLARNEVNLPFGDGVDPNGVLANVRGQDLIHGPDNQVTYVRRLKNGRCCLLNLQLGTSVTDIDSSATRQSNLRASSWETS